MKRDKKKGRLKDTTFSERVYLKSDAVKSGRSVSIFLGWACCLVSLGFPWRLRYQVPPKHLYPSTRLNGVTSWKTETQISERESFCMSLRYIREWAKKFPLEIFLELVKSKLRNTRRYNYYGTRKSSELQFQPIIITCMWSEEENKCLINHESITKQHMRRGWVLRHILIHLKSKPPLTMHFYFMSAQCWLIY